MIAHYKTDRQKLTIIIDVITRGKEDVCVKVRDQGKPYTVYADRCKTIKGSGKFYLRFPQSPEHAEIIITSKNRGGHFKVKGIKLKKLKTKLSSFDFRDPKIISFVNFAQEFSENAGILDSSSAIYMSDDSRFRIDYVDIIRDRRSGKPLNTPARISKSRGVIEIAKQKFKDYTVPMRMAILLHEFSHFYLNKKMDDETEADLNALLIYLGLGYSRIEAAEVFLKVFYKTASDGNKERYKIIESMITNFEKNNYSLIGDNNKYYYNGEF